MDAVPVDGLSIVLHCGQCCGSLFRMRNWPGAPRRGTAANAPAPSRGDRHSRRADRTRRGPPPHTVEEITVHQPRCRRR